MTPSTSDPSGKARPTHPPTRQRQASAGGRLADDRVPDRQTQSERFLADSSATGVPGTDAMVRAVAAPEGRRSVRRTRMVPAVAEFWPGRRLRVLRRHAIDVRPLRHPAYRRLFLGNAVAFFGYQFTAVAVPVQMYAMTGSSLWVGLLGLAALVPLLLFALWGGAVADAFDRRRVLLSSSLLTWASTLTLLGQAVVGLRSPAFLLGVVAVQAAAFAISNPTRGAIVPQLVPMAEVASANTLSFTVTNAGMVAGPLVAGLVVAGGKFPVAYAVDAVAFTAALWAVLRLPPLPPSRDPAPDPRDRTRDPPATPDPAARGRPRAGRLGEIVEGLRYLTGTPLILLTFAVDIVAMALALPRALFPQVATERFGEGSIGWLYGAIAIGSVLAGLTSGWIGRVRRQGAALVVAVVAWGLAVGVAGAVPTLWLTVLLLAVGGAADLVSGVYRQTVLLTYAPDAMRGRLQGSSSRWSPAGRTSVTSGRAGWHISPDRRWPGWRAGWPPR